MQERVSPDLLLVDFTLAQNFYSLSPKLFLFEKVINFVKSESFFGKQNVLGLQKVKNLVMSANLYQVIKVKFSSILLDFPPFHNVQSIECASGSHFITDAHIGRVVAKLSCLGKIELKC